MNDESVRIAVLTAFTQLLTAVLKEDLLLTALEDILSECVKDTSKLLYLRGILKHDPLLTHLGKPVPPEWLSSEFMYRTLASRLSRTLQVYFPAITYPHLMAAIVCVLFTLEIDRKPRIAPSILHGHCRQLLKGEVGFAASKKTFYRYLRKLERRELITRTAEKYTVSASPRRRSSWRASRRYTYVQYCITQTGIDIVWQAYHEEAIAYNAQRYGLSSRSPKSES